MFSEFCSPLAEVLSITALKQVLVCQNQTSGSKVTGLQSSALKYHQNSVIWAYFPKIFLGGAPPSLGQIDPPLGGASKYF